MDQLSDADVSELQVRAFGPNQPPLSDAELSRLRAMEHRAKKGSGPAPEVDESARVGASMRRRKVGWVAVAGISVMLAGFAGYAYGSGSLSTSMSQPERLGNGTELEDGIFRQYSDAACDLLFSAEDATLTGVHCVWDDGAEVTLSMDDSDDARP